MKHAAAGAPVVLLDLDRMLFDTDHFGRDLSALLQARFHVSAEAYLRTYPSYYVYSGELRYNDFFRHMRDLELDADMVETAILTDLEPNTYLYDDVPDFITGACMRDAEAMVLTHGEHRFQHLKYKLCPQLHIMPCTDVLTHKRDFIAASFKGRYGLLLDDQLIEALPPGFKPVRVSRYAAADAFHSLTEVAGKWDRLLEAAWASR